MPENKGKILSGDVKQYLNETVKKTIKDEMKREPERVKIKPSLDKQYIEDHLPNIHTPDSFGRAIVDLMLREGINRLDKLKQPTDKLSFDAKITLEPVAAYDKDKCCIEICIGFPFAKICYQHHNG